MLDFDEFIYKKDKKIMIKGKFYCVDVFFFFKSWIRGFCKL